VEGPQRKLPPETPTRTDRVIDQLKAGMADEIEKSTDKNLIKKARAQGIPIAQKLLAAREKVNKIQDSLLEEAIFTSIGLISRVKQKALSGVLEWLEEFCQNKERLIDLSPAQAKMLLSIAFTADQMGRLELGKSTSNVAIAHNSNNAAETSRLQQAVDKLKEIDPVFDYSQVEVKAIPVTQLLPEESDAERVLSEGEGSGEPSEADGVQHDGGGARSDDGGPLSPDK
jgi:hypothetical protein